MRKELEKPVSPKSDFDRSGNSAKIHPVSILMPASKSLLNSFLAVIIVAATLLCSPVYCVGLGDLSGRATPSSESRSCCSSTGSEEAPAQPVNSSCSGECGSCPFMSGSIDSKSPSLELPSPKISRLLELPEWWTAENVFRPGVAGPSAANSKFRSRMPEVFGRSSGLRAHHCVYLI